MYIIYTHYIISVSFITIINGKLTLISNHLHRGKDVSVAICQSYLNVANRRLVLGLAHTTECLYKSHNNYSDSISRFIVLVFSIVCVKIKLLTTCKTCVDAILVLRGVLM